MPVLVLELALVLVLVLVLAALYRSWIQPMLDNQALNGKGDPARYGAVNSIVPPGDWPISTADASWGLAIGEVPYQLLRQYGDVAAVTNAYPAIRRYWQFLVNNTDPATGLMTDQAQWGDWDAAFDRHLYQTNSKFIAATSAHMRLAQLLEELAPIAQATEDTMEYVQFLAKSQGLYNVKYRNRTTPYVYVDGIEQTVTLLPLSLGFVPEGLIEKSEDWLINDIEHTREMHLSTGAIGTRLLFPYLSSIGRTDLAAEIAAQSTFPSHGFWITKGATTCWENWSQCQKLYRQSQ